VVFGVGHEKELLTSFCRIRKPIDFNFEAEEPDRNGWAPRLSDSVFTYKLERGSSSGIDLKGMYNMDITFSGGTAVDACFDGLRVHTEQPKGDGGQNLAPAPFDLFLASMGTCAGFYALRFCQERELVTEGLRLTLETERDAEGRHRLSRVRITIHLPPAFPEKYRRAIVRATNQCSVKRTVLDPPEFDVIAV
jgi:ribosomal protein S12 methylthiotransferase accessory factor